MAERQREPCTLATMPRRGVSSLLKAHLLLFAGLLLARSAEAAVNTTISVNASQNRSAVIVRTPNSNPSGANWALPVVMLLHERCKDAATADSDSTFSFTPLVDKARAPGWKLFPCKWRPALHRRRVSVGFLVILRHYEVKCTVY